MQVDGLVIMGSVVVQGKVDLCLAMLGKVLNKFEGGRLSTNWLEKNLDKLLDDVMKESWAWWRIPFPHLRVTDPYTFSLLIRIIDKLYLQPPEAMSRQIRPKRQRRLPQQQPTSPINYPHTDVDVKPYIGIDVDIYTATNNDTDANAHASIDANGWLIVATTRRRSSGYIVADKDDATIDHEEDETATNPEETIA
ncbi:hypothetical protein PVK06_012065 [Gossypium arboreum]|uniref:Uncharacterized protein n=1 Tax=Gossypium arboreum TaxID=29729 RepID=A0ABR0QBE8_GOSAR|nr:hypothetical protein PVK06_012065 [Gossypium arboreum]